MAVLGRVIYNGPATIAQRGAMRLTALLPVRREHFEGKSCCLWEVGQPMEIQEVDLDEPKTGEVLVKIGSPVSAVATDTLCTATHQSPSP